MEEEKPVAEIMNNYFVNMTKTLNLKDFLESNVDNIGSNIMHSFKNVSIENHESVVKIIKEKNTDNGQFHFQPVSTEEVKKIIIDLANVLKDTCGTFILYLTEIINDSFQTGNLPNNSYMAPRFSYLLCGFRKNHNTQHSLLKMLEKWKLVLEFGCKIGDRRCKIFLYFRTGLSFEREFMIHLLFLFPLSTLVMRGTMEYPSEGFL